MDLTKISSEVLRDAHLGSTGRVFICNKDGKIVAGIRPEDQVITSARTGTVSYRRVWELGESWASTLTAEVFDKTVEQRFTLDDGTLVVVSPFSDAHSGMSDFFVVIVTTREPFTDQLLLVFCILACILALLPYVIVFVVIAIFMLRQRAIKARYQRRMLAVEEAKMAITDMDGPNMAITDHSADAGGGGGGES